jgi:DNA-binding NtrC family response regulator
MADEPQIGPLDLGLLTGIKSDDESEFSRYQGMSLVEAKSQIVEALERSLISAALNRAEGNVSEAARQLGMHRQSLQQKISQLGIRK